MWESSRVSDVDLDLDTVVRIFEEVPVRRGILFGSYARGDDRSTSDIDLAVEFEESLSSMERTRSRLRLIDRLSVELGIDTIDVVPLDTASADLRREIQYDGIVLYGPTTRLELDGESATSTETIERFDEILGEIEDVV